jgi:hypothetical protein
MDIKLIEDKQLVERWLRGKLPPPETRFFEQMVRKEPELADRLRLHESLQRIMKLLDETGTEWREEQPKAWHSPVVPIALAGALVLALLLAVAGWVGKANLQQRYASLETEALKGILNVPTTSATLRLHLAKEGEAVPVVSIGGRERANFAELRIDVSQVKGTLYTIIMKRLDGTYVARVENLLRNSNGDILFALNSSALATGDYELDVRVVNLRGDGERVGRAKLRVDAR